MEGRMVLDLVHPDLLLNGVTQLQNGDTLTNDLPPDRVLGYLVECTSSGKYK